MTTKALMRSRYRDLEHNRPADRVASASQAIYEKLITQEVFQQARCIGAYLALPTEVQTRALIAACWENGATVCVPYYIPEQRFYGLSRLDPTMPLRPQQWNVLEPEKPEPVDPATLDLILVPGMAFDRRGVRLGHGGGHYDRLLLQVKGFRLGLAFHDQIAEDLPREPHDEPVHAILTDERLIEVTA